jgi:hypothetical protein
VGPQSWKVASRASAVPETRAGLDTVAPAAGVSATIGASTVPPDCKRRRDQPDDERCEPGAGRSGECAAGGFSPGLDTLSILAHMSPIAVVLLAAAIAIVGACEWPRLSRRLGGSKRPTRVSRRRSKANLRVVSSDHEEFARSVERDLASLPTIDEQDAKRR